MLPQREKGHTTILRTLLSKNPANFPTIIWYIQTYRLCSSGNSLFEFMYSLISPLYTWKPKHRDAPDVKGGTPAGRKGADRYAR